MTDTWEGAQWVLAFWLALQVSFFPIVGGYIKSEQGGFDVAKHMVWWLGRIMSCGTLALILNWGGFWS